MEHKITEYILKHSKKKDKELKYDFMPSMLEIIERPAHKAGTVIILGVFTLLIAVVIWACLSKTDIVITSRGSIHPVGNITVVQSYAGGIVKGIYVTEGTYVEKGTVLIELDTESLEIDENQLTHQRGILEIQQSIYRKIKLGEDISLIQVEEYSEEFRNYVQVILDADISYKNTLNNISMEKESIDLNLQIAKIQQKEYEVNGTKREVEMQKLMVQQYELALEQSDLQMEDAKTQYSFQIATKLSEIESQLEEIDSNLEKYRISKEYQKITAPVSGYVNSVSVHMVGDTVSAAQQVISIVPDQTPLEMVCYVKNQDIADVEVGMETEIKLEAYPYNKYGTVKGIVKYVSPSSFASEELGNVYLVKVDMTEYPTDIRLISGLSGTVEIKTGKRTIMEYFMEPIKKGFSESLKEK